MTLRKSRGCFCDSYYDPARSSAEEYIQAAAAAYNAGLTGADVNGVTSPVLTRSQRDAAYMAGRADARNGQTTQASTEIAQTAQPATQQTTTAPAAAQTVAPAAQTTPGGSSETTMNTVPESVKTEGIKKADAEAAAKGYKINWYTGTLVTTDTDGTHERRAVVDLDNKVMWIAADDEDADPYQLWKHEEYHTLPKNTRAQIAQQFLDTHQDDLNELIDEYVKAYTYAVDADGKPLVGADYITEEILADAYAGIDVLAGTYTEAEGATKFTEETRAAVESAETEASTERGPPAEGQKFSSRAQKGRPIELETMDNNRFERLRQFHGDLPAEWYAFTNDFFYVYSNQSYMDYTILAQARINEKNRNAINAFMEALEDGTFSPAETFDSWTSAFRRGKGRYNWNRINDRYAGKTEASHGVDVRERGSKRSGDSEKGGSNRGESVKHSTKITKQQDTDYMAAVERETPRPRRRWWTRRRRRRGILSRRGMDRAIWSTSSRAGSGEKTRGQKRANAGFLRETTTRQIRIIRPASCGS